MTRDDFESPPPIERSSDAKLPPGIVLSRNRIAFAWLLKLRWAAVCGQIATVFTAAVVFRVELPLAELVSLIVFAAATNIGFLVWFRRRLLTRPAGETRDLETRIMTAIMVIDVLLLSGLLYFSGGPTNPFSVFYLVNLTLGAVLLRERWAYTLSVLVFSCFTLLFFFHQPLPALGDITTMTLEWPGREGPIPPVRLYLIATVVAFGASALIVVSFILRVSSELARREDDLRGVRQQRAHSEKLEALATLAAGAAHELASPLSTIAVIAKDLEVQLERGAPLDDAVEDSRLIRAEVGRCRAILDEMAAEAGQGTGDTLVRVTIDDLVEEVLDGIVDRTRVHVFGLETTTEHRLFAPLGPLSRALRAIVKNALDAAPPDSHVDLTCSGRRESVVFEVTDRGAGMDSDMLRRVGNPFFTTKDPGRGMGLGLFLTRTVVEKLGGELDFESTVGTGTTVTITLPTEREPEAS